MVTIVSTSLFFNNNDLSLSVRLNTSEELFSFVCVCFFFFFSLSFITHLCTPPYDPFTANFNTPLTLLADCKGFFLVFVCLL